MFYVISVYFRKLIQTQRLFTSVHGVVGDRVSKVVH